MKTLLNIDVSILMCSCDLSANCTKITYLCISSVPVRIVRPALLQTGDHGNDAGRGDTDIRDTLQLSILYADIVSVIKSFLKAL